MFCENLVASSSISGFKSFLSLSFAVGSDYLKTMLQVIAVFDASFTRITLKQDSFNVSL